MTAVLLWPPTDRAWMVAGGMVVALMLLRSALGQAPPDAVSPRSPSPEEAQPSSPTPGGAQSLPLPQRPGAQPTFEQRDPSTALPTPAPPSAAAPQGNSPPAASPPENAEPNEPANDAAAALGPAAAGQARSEQFRQQVDQQSQALIDVTRTLSDARLRLPAQTVEELQIRVRDIHQGLLSFGRDGVEPAPDLAGQVMERMQQLHSDLQVEVQVAQGEARQELERLAGILQQTHAGFEQTIRARRQANLHIRDPLRADELRQQGVISPSLGWQGGRIQDRAGDAIPFGIDVESHAGDRPALGVRVAPLAQGLVVQTVYTGSGAARAGLQPGDEILSAHGVSTRNVTDLTRAVQSAGAPAVRLVVRRQGQMFTVLAPLTPHRELAHDQGVIPRR